MNILGCPNGPPPTRIARSTHTQNTHPNPTTLKPPKLQTHAPPSQTAILLSLIITGSLFTISIALNGAGWNSYATCSKRGFEPGAGRRFWLVDQGAGALGAWGTGVTWDWDWEVTGGTGVLASEGTECEEADVEVEEVESVRGRERARGLDAPRTRD